MYSINYKTKKEANESGKKAMVGLEESWNLVVSEDTGSTQRQYFNQYLNKSKEVEVQELKTDKGEVIYFAYQNNSDLNGEGKSIQEALKNLKKEILARMKYYKEMAEKI
jgi:hypothetical protein